MPKQAKQSESLVEELNAKIIQIENLIKENETLKKQNANVEKLRKEVFDYALKERQLNGEIDKLKRALAQSQCQVKKWFLVYKRQSLSEEALYADENRDIEELERQVFGRFANASCTRPSTILRAESSSTLADTDELDFTEDESESDFEDFQMRSQSTDTM
jgi:hypothetical protein